MNELAQPQLPDDPLQLNAMLEELKAKQIERKRTGLVIPESSSQAEADRLRRDWNFAIAEDTRMMIAIVTKLRKTTAGPAARGGKRAKKAPVDFDAFAMSLNLEKQQ